MNALHPALLDFVSWRDDAGRLTERVFVYHRGELARDKVDSPALKALADLVLAASNCSFPIVSRCGHVRGWLHGTGQVRVVSWREDGEIVHAAVRAAQAAGHEQPVPLRKANHP